MALATIELKATTHGGPFADFIAEVAHDALSSKAPQGEPSPLPVNSTERSGEAVQRAADGDLAQRAPPKSLHERLSEQWNDSEWRAYSEGYADCAAVRAVKLQNK